MSATYTIGDGKTYSTIQLGIDAIPGDLSGQGEQTAEVYYYDADDHSAPFPENNLDVFTGFSNTSSTDRIYITAMVSHAGVIGGGINIYLKNTALNYGMALCAYTVFDGFCVTQPDSTYSGLQIILGCGGANPYGIVVKNNIFYNWNTVGGDVFAIYMNSDRDFQLFNNIFVNQLFNAAYNQGCVACTNSGSSGFEHKIYNNTALTANAGSGGSTGIFTYGGAMGYIFLANNYANGDGMSAMFGFTGPGVVSNFNITSDSTADDFGGTGNLVNKAAADQFECVTAGFENLNLKPMSVCNRPGQDNSSIFTTDCAGNTWEHWETGALKAIYKQTIGTSDRTSINGDNNHDVYVNGVELE